MERPSNLRSPGMGTTWWTPRLVMWTGSPAATAPFTGSAYVEFDYGIVEPVECIPSDRDTDTHEEPRREPMGQEQARIFLEEGQVQHTCDGACDPS